MAESETQTEPGTETVLPAVVKTLKRRAVQPGTDTHSAFPKLERMLSTRAEVGTQQYKALLDARNGGDALVSAWDGAADLVFTLQKAELEGKGVYWPLEQAVSLLFDLTLDIQEARPS